MSLPHASLPALLALVTLPGCWNIERMSPNQPCKEVGYAISSRIYDCTGDPDAANAAYEDLFAAYQCIPVDTEQSPVDDFFHCGVTIGGLDCDTVLSYGEDWERWLAVSPACPYVIEPRDGEDTAR